MPLSSSIVDYEFRPLSHKIDQRWLMAFAASVGDARPELMDTARSGGIIAHPLFTLAVEWPAYLVVARELIALGLSQAEAMVAEPLTYDVHLHRSVRAGETLATIPAVLAVEAHPSGTVVTIEWTTANGGGALVARATSRVLFPGSPLRGHPAHRPATGRPDEPAVGRAGGPGAGRAVRGAGRGEQPGRRAGPPGDDGRVIDLRTTSDGWSAGGAAGVGAAADGSVRRGRRAIGAAAAHVFAECSGIWNPLHTDRAVALDAGRPGLTMPPTAVLAMTVGSVLQLGDDDPGCVRSVGATFAGSVPVPASVVVVATVPPPGPDRAVTFSTSIDGASRPAIEGTVTVEAAPIDPADLRPARPARTGALRWHRAKSTF